DSVDYDDDLPWNRNADSRGQSLQRICPTADSDSPANWGAEAGDSPTPGAVNVATQCPPPTLSAPEIAITEIHYHPANDRDDDHEFIELRNLTNGTVDLQDYCFTSGIDFCFTQSTPVAPGEHVVVCRNLAAMESDFGVSNGVGDWDGGLSNSGERITLLAADGSLADSVRFSDQDEWPVAADGLGRSLEKIVPEATSDDPASWSDSGGLNSVVSNDWQTVTISGNATSSRLYFYMRGAGEMLIDNVSIVDVANPGDNFISNGSFTNNITGWSDTGTQAARWSRAPGGTIFDDRALHIISSGSGSGSSNSVFIETTEELERSGVTYRLSFDYLLLSGAREFIARLSSSTRSRGIYFELDESSANSVVTPGEVNLVDREALPPHIGHIGRFPKEPRSDDWVWITAEVRGNPASVRIVPDILSGNEPIEMFDDGESNDGAAGDGVYGVAIPPQPHDTVVPYRIEASSAGGTRVSPTDSDTSEAHAYYVSDYQPASDLPVYTFIIDGNPRSFIGGLNCSTYRPFSFAYQGDVFYNIEIRARGGSVCGSTKRYLKVKFRRGHEFNGYRRMNFQSIWTDKSLVRERLAWDTAGELDLDTFYHYYVRLHANGDYFALYAAYQHPDEEFLADNNLDDDGTLYKATASREQRDGWTYEVKTGEDPSFNRLRNFLHEMHDTPTNQLVEFFEANVDPDKMIDYQALQVIINNRDYPHKNHYLFQDSETGLWWPVAWDIDLSYGKRWDGGNSGVYNDLMDSPGMTIWNATSVRGGGAGNHLMDRFFSRAGTYYRRAFLVRLWDALTEKFTLDRLEEHIQAHRGTLFDEQLEDIAEWGRTSPSNNDRNAPSAFDPNLDRVRAHERSRRTYLLNYLRGTEGFT
ncbi:MAG: CotH kinase family protein, partial [Planctomycetota bacterium]